MTERRGSATSPDQLALVRAEPFGDLTVYVLGEPSTGSEARVVPEAGCSVIAFRTSVGGADVEVLTPPSAVALREQPDGHGIAVLVPCLGRTRRGCREARLNDAPASGDEPARGPWRVVSTSTADGAALRCQMDESADDALAAEWAPRLSLEAHLRAGALTLTLTAENAGRRTLPVDLGLRPCLAAPRGGHGPQPDARASLPGPVEHLLYATPSTQPPDASGGIAYTVVDATGRTEVRLEASAGFGALVRFAPRGAHSPEPHPRPTDLARPAPEGGIALEPGETWRGWVRLSASAR